MKSIHYTKSIHRAHKEILKLEMKPLRSSLFNWSLEAINVKFLGKNLFWSVPLQSSFYYSYLFNLDRDCRAVSGINFNPISTPVSYYLSGVFEMLCLQFAWSRVIRLDLSCASICIHYWELCELWIVGSVCWDSVCFLIIFF